MKYKCLTILILGIFPLIYGPSMAVAQQLSTFGVLGGSTVTNTGPTAVTFNLGVSPGSAVTGFPPGIVTGTIHSADAVAAQAQNDLTTLYNQLAGTACNTSLTGQDLGGLTLTPGIYCFSTSAQLTGILTLDQQGNPNAIFVFQIGSTLTTASNSSVLLINSGGGCGGGVFWQVGSSATLGTGTTFVGSIAALTSITLNTGAGLAGRALARNGAVTLASNAVTVCGAGPNLPPILPPSISKVFGAAAILLMNGTTSLSFSIANPNAGSTLTGIGFADILPAGLVVATPNGLTGSCAGTLPTAVAGSGIVSLSGATLAANASCTFSVNVQGTAFGTQNNTTSNVRSNEAGNGNQARANINVVLASAIPVMSMPALAAFALLLAGLGLVLARRAKTLG